MRMTYLSAAATLAVVPAVLAGCGSASSSGSQSASASGSQSAPASSASGSVSASVSASGDRGAVNNDAGAQAFANDMDNGEVGNGILSIMTQGYPDILESCKASAIGLNPVVVINYTGVDQYFNVTDNTELANNITWLPPGPMQTAAAGSIQCVGGPGSYLVNQAFKVPASSNTSVLLMAGGHDGPHTQLFGDQHNLSVAGGGSGGAQWYDLWLHLQPDDKFENWELGYENTGGLDPAQNTQGGLFNAVECSISADGTVTTGAAWINGTLTTLPQTTIATPYGSNQNRWQYNNGDPICFGFFDPNAPGVAQQGA